jgi:hypothetical protein
MAAVDPAGEKQRQLASVAYSLDQAWQRVLRAPSADAENLYASALRRVSRWADANPTHQLIDSSDPGAGEGGDTRELALLVGISRHPASVLAFNKIKERHPDVLTKEFGGMTLADHIGQAIEDAKTDHDSAGHQVLQQKLNPGRLETVKLERVFGKRGGPIGDAVGLVDEMLTGDPLNKQRGRVTKKGGRRKTRNTRKARKTKRQTRKTK